MALLVTSVVGAIASLLKAQEAEKSRPAYNRPYEPNLELLADAFQMKRWKSCFDTMPEWSSVQHGGEDLRGDIIAELADGSIALFGYAAPQAWARKFKQRATDHVRDLLVSGIPQVDISQKPVPAHIKLILDATGINADTVATFAWLMNDVAFSKDKRRFHFIAGPSVKDSSAAHMHRRRIRYDQKDWRKTTIRLPGSGQSPDSRVTLRGISIRTILPEALQASLIGEPLGKLVDMPGLSDRKITAIETVQHSTKFRLEGL